MILTILTLFNAKVPCNVLFLLKKTILHNHIIFKHQTTIMAVEFDGGVIIGADSRTSTGSYVANRVTDKLTKITDKIYCCRSGSAADTQAIADIVSYSTYFYENQNGTDAQVSEVAAEFRKFCYNYRDSITAGIIVA